MTFEEFVQEVIDTIKLFLPGKYDGASITTHEVVKNNYIHLTALIIQNGESNVAPSIYLNSFYEQYQDGKNMSEIMVQISEVQLSHEVTQDFDVKSVTEWEQVKDKIVPRVVGAEMNEELLSERPHTMVADLAVTYHIMLGENSNGTMSIPVTNQLMEHYGVTIEELHEAATTNMPELSPATFKSMNEVMRDMMLPNVIEACDGDVEAAKEMIESMMPAENVMYVVSNEQKMHGATSIINPVLMDRIAEQVGDNYFILPSSLHECLVVPREAGMDYKELEAMVKEVNATQVSVADRLSDHVYAYDQIIMRFILLNKSRSI